MKDLKSQIADQNSQLTSTNSQTRIATPPSILINSYKYLNLTIEMKVFSASLLLPFLLCIPSTLGQNYDDYQEYQDYAEYGAQQDTLYHDYAERQEGKR